MEGVANRQIRRRALRLLNCRIGKVALMTRSFFLLVSLLTAGAAAATLHESVGEERSIVLQALPPAPTTHDLIRIRMTIEGCAIVSFLSTEWIGDVLNVRLDSADYCNPEDVIPEQFLDIGYLPESTYQFRYLMCVNAPPPVDPCELFAEETVNVRGSSPTPHAVPTVSMWSAAILVSVLLFFGAVALNRSR